MVFPISFETSDKLIEKRMVSSWQNSGIRDSSLHANFIKCFYMGANFKSEEKKGT